MLHLKSCIDVFLYYWFTLATFKINDQAVVNDEPSITVLIAESKEV